jgi:integrase
MKYCRKANTTSLHPEDLTISSGAKRPNKSIVGTQDIKTLFSSCSTTRYGEIVPDIHIHAYRFSVLTGIRPGERTGLQWRDISGSTIHIRRAINDDQEVTGGKNDNAARVISISTLAQKELDDPADGYRLKICVPRCRWQLCNSETVP